MLVVPVSTAPFNAPVLPLRDETTLEVKAIVPLVAGKSITVVPATAGSCSVTLPLVEPNQTLDICFPYKITQRLPLGTVTVAPESILIGPTDEAFLPAGITYDVVTVCPFSTNI